MEANPSKREKSHSRQRGNSYGCFRLHSLCKTDIRDKFWGKDYGKALKKCLGNKPSDFVEIVIILSD